MISASCLCLVATQSGRSLFRGIGIFQFFALISSFSVGFDGFDKSGALIFNNAEPRPLISRSSQEPAVTGGIFSYQATIDSNHLQGPLFQIVSLLGVEGEDLPCNLAIHNDQRSDGPGAKATHCRQPVAAIRRPETL